MGFREILIQTPSSSRGRSRGGGLEEMMLFIDQRASISVVLKKKKKLILLLIRVVLTNADEQYAPSSPASCKVCCDRAARIWHLYAITNNKLAFNNWQYLAWLF